VTGVRFFKNIRPRLRLRLLSKEKRNWGSPRQGALTSVGETIAASATCWEPYPRVREERYARLERPDRIFLFLFVTPPVFIEGSTCIGTHFFKGQVPILSFTLISFVKYFVALRIDRRSRLWSSRIQIDPFVCLRSKLLSLSPLSLWRPLPTTPKFSSRLSLTVSLPGLVCYRKWGLDFRPHDFH